MKTKIAKMTFCIQTFFLLFFFILSSNLFAGSGKVDLGGNIIQFRKAISAIEKIPYNPRPIATNTADVTGISVENSQSLFLNTFHRVLINAPANGRTFFASERGNAADITLVGYMGTQTGLKGSAKPWIIVTHGGAGGASSIAMHDGFLIHISNVLFANGYNVLALDRRDGLLSRCAYVYDPQTKTLQPDPDHSSPGRVYSDWTTEYCNNLPYAFREEQVKDNFHANSLPFDSQAFSPGDILAAAQFLKNEKRAVRIGALGGSNGGINIIRAASIQDQPDNDFKAGLLDAILAFSPIGDVNTLAYASKSYTFPCGIAGMAKFYSTEIKGTGITDFDTDPKSSLEEFLVLLNGVNIVKKVKIPVLLIYTLTDQATYAAEGLAYKTKTDTMTLGHTMIMSTLGHFHEIWHSDPYWGDKLVLTYFRSLLAYNDPWIGDNPGFPSLGPRTNNPYIIDLKVNKNAYMLLSEESIVPFLLNNCLEP